MEYRSNGIEADWLYQEDRGDAARLFLNHRIIVAGHDGDRAVLRYRPEQQGQLQSVVGSDPNIGQKSARYQLTQCLPGLFKSRIYPDRMPIVSQRRRVQDPERRIVFENQNVQDYFNYSGAKVFKRYRPVTGKSMQELMAIRDM